MPPRRPTILQIIPRLDTGGAERTTVEIAQTIVSAGGRAIVVSDGGRMLPQVAKVGGEVIELRAASKNPAVMTGNGLALRRIIRTEKVDLIHARSRAPAWSALMAARMTGIPFVTTYHGAYAESGALKRTYNSVMARGDVVIANSRYTADLIRNRYGTPEDRIRVIHRGLDDQFDPQRVSPEKIAQMRAAWGVRPDQRVVLNAGRLTQWKGQGVLIAAAGLLAERKDLGDWIVILAGDDQGRTGYSDGLRQQITSLGLQDRVKLIGHVDDMPTAYMAAHLSVVASTGAEAFGRAAAEAEAMSCPILATDIGAAPETVRAEPKVGPEEITGWLVPPGDAEALARCLDAALRLSEAERTAIGQRARAYVMERFTLTAMQQATLKVYDTLLGTNMAQQTQP